ncbi:unnamed protein product [Closterium sp. NIES-65]|nr:unnamed protein product [Closterium sp. NIES-65]
MGVYNPLCLPTVVSHARLCLPPRPLLVHRCSSPPAPLPPPLSPRPPPPAPLPPPLSPRPSPPAPLPPPLSPRPSPPSPSLLPTTSYYIAAPLSFFLAAPTTSLPRSPSSLLPVLLCPAPSSFITTSPTPFLRRLKIAYYIAAPLSFFLAGHPVTPSEPFSTTGADVISIACHIVGAAVFAWGNLHQHRCHAILASLRQGGKKGYFIPQGDWFTHVSCPHYLAEIVSISNTGDNQ